MPPADDADDELSGISPELVLVDPELARLVREREAAVAPSALSGPRRGSPLRLVAAPGVEPAIVPRRVPSEAPVAEEPKHEPFADTRTVASAPVQSPPSVAAAAPAATTPVEVSERVVEPEPARVSDPPRPSIPPPLAEPVRRSTGTPRPEEAAQLFGAAEPAMPHPVRRTSIPPRPAAARRPPRRGRRLLLQLGGVAAASVAVLAVLQLTGGPSESTQTVAGPPAQSRARPPRHVLPQKPTGQTERPAAKTDSRAAPSKSTTAAKPAAAGSTRPKTVTKPNAHTTAPPKVAPALPLPKPNATKSARVAPVTASGARHATRFAWASVPGAIGYHLELFKGVERVFVQETKEPVLDLAQTWRYKGRTMRLTPGAYRWYVWPVTTSGRAREAVVRATFTV